MLNGVFMIDVKGLQTHHCHKTHQIVKPFARHKDDREALALQCDSQNVFSDVMEVGLHVHSPPYRSGSP